MTSKINILFCYCFIKNRLIEHLMHACYTRCIPITNILIKSCITCKHTIQICHFRYIPSNIFTTICFFFYRSIYIITTTIKYLITWKHILYFCNIRCIPFTNISIKRTWRTGKHRFHICHIRNIPIANILIKINIIK